ncbi:hypothetical protein HFO49_26605 [Rhizobium leguminosarum]|uniref:hypothetical protein n=1 Tax=Rhizobium leguminosarum TaxID=384 RepID=UPI001C9451BC|nr:hypothetical protein [Rhizobium leguminosarum]MBY5591013.1 hypothetical protein [Rhizobium leguminosarum]MBY5604766.1 hypothetical protein [Rhizobium leguminosarum]
MLEPEIALDGGNVNAAVVRVGCRPPAPRRPFEHWRCEAEAFALNLIGPGRAL